MNEEYELQAIARGDKSAFERIFFLYYSKLVRFLAGMVQDEDVGRDMAQDIFLSLWEERVRLAEVRDFSSYLFMIARYTVFNYYDHLAVERKFAAAVLAKYPVVSESEEEKIFVKELNAYINRVVENLSPQRRTVYKLSRQEGLTNEEIAQRLHISKRTVENHLTAVLAVLRRAVLLMCIINLR